MVNAEYLTERLRDKTLSPEYRALLKQLRDSLTSYHGFQVGDEILIDGHAAVVCTPEEVLKGNPAWGHSGNDKELRENRVPFHYKERHHHRPQWGGALAMVVERA